MLVNPLLICMDLQLEFLTARRPHLISDPARTIDNCRKLQSRWRAHLWPVAHLKRTATAAYFNPTSNLTEWINELRPLPGELTFEHALPSAFSSIKFADFMKHIGPLRCFIAGFALQESILATVIEGFHRGIRFDVIADAVDGTQNAMSLATLDILRPFCELTYTDTISTLAIE